MAIVTPGYFRAIGAPLLGGRELTERDDAAAPPVVLVNRAFADRFFPGEDALGKRIKPGATDEGGTRTREIVGIVENVRQSPLGREPEPIYYMPYLQLPWCCPFVIVRTSESSPLVETSVRALVESMDRQLPIHDVRTAEDILATGIAPPRILMTLFASFASMALLLTLVGIYGVIACAVVTRTREIGVRIALGADRRTILSIVLKRAIFLVSLGIAIGLTGSFFGTQILRKILFGVAPGDPLLLGLTCCVVMLTAALAAYLPARRAASIDPIEALRSE
jgi:predicted permease